MQVPEELSIWEEELVAVCCCFWALAQALQTDCSCQPRCFPSEETPCDLWVQTALNDSCQRDDGRQLEGSSRWSRAQCGWAAPEPDCV